jgi:glycosyltransferase involved in cell wall biosynthesis
LPALVSDVGGPKEIVVNGQTGYVLPVTDAAIWSKALERMLTDLKEGGESYALMSKTARSRVENNYSWDRILDNMVKADAIDTPRQHKLRHHSPFKRLLKLASSMMVG